MRWWTIWKRREFSVLSDEQSPQTLRKVGLVPRHTIWGSLLQEKKYQDWINPKRICILLRTVLPSSCSGWLIWACTPLCGKPETQLMGVRTVNLIKRVKMEEGKSEVVGKKKSGSERRVPLSPPPVLLLIGHGWTQPLWGIKASDPSFRPAVSRGWLACHFAGSRFSTCLSRLPHPAQPLNCVL